MARVGQRSVQTPEDLDDAHRRLRDRLGNIAARRGDSADGGQRAAPLVRAEALDAACAFVELRQTRSQIRGIAFFAGHLFQTARHFTQGLGPAGGGVGDNGDVIAHVAEILRDGDAGVDGRFTRRDRHIGGVCNQDCALHQGFAGVGVVQLRELHQNVSHFVAAFAAADVDDDIDVRPLCQLVLHDGLARTERAGDGGCAALGQREHGVDDALAGHKGLRGGKFPVIRTGHAHGPLLHEA